MKRDEPKRHPLYMFLLALSALATVPFLTAGGSSSFMWGLPTWLWLSLAATCLFAGLTAYGILRYWRDDDNE